MNDNAPTSTPHPDRHFTPQQLQRMLPLERRLVALALAGTPVTLRFRNDPTGTVGPGLVEVIDIASDESPQDQEIRRLSGDDEGRRLYKISIQVMLGDPRQPNQPGKLGTMPMEFEARDVMWLSTGPVVKEAPRLVTPGGERTTGGLIVKH